MTCLHCEELEAQNRVLRGKLAMDLDRSRIATLCRTFRFAPQVGMVVVALHSVNGRVLSRGQLDERLGDPTGTTMRSFKHIEVLVNRARSAMGSATIETQWGLGYRLTDLGRLIVDEALEGPKVRAA